MSLQIIFLKQKTSLIDFELRTVIVESLMKTSDYKGQILSVFKVLLYNVPKSNSKHKK